MTAPEIIRPQAVQEQFLASSADIAIFGGSVFSGKTFSLLMEPLRHINNPGFTFVLFRRVTPEIRYPGGLWDESMKLYPGVGAEARGGSLEWVFPSGAKGKFAGLQYEQDVLDWKGAQLTLIMFDQLESFEESQFWYLTSRNRSQCGVRPYIRATCNPDPDSFLVELLAWWIDDAGYAIPERSGKLRWFLREKEDLVWADSLQEFIDRYGRERAADAKSLTYVLGRLQDNQIGNANDPGYLATMKAMPLVEQERLLGGDRGGNWKIRAAAGLVFNRGWCEIVEASPAVAKRARGWDSASSPGKGDGTASVPMAKAGKLYYIEDATWEQLAANDRLKLQRSLAETDGKTCAIRFEQEPGSAGKEAVANWIANVAGFTAHSKTATGDKLVRFNPFAAQAQAGNVKVVRGAWNELWLRNLHAFPTKGVPDDLVDATSCAFDELTDRQALPSAFRISTGDVGSPFEV